MSSEKFPVLMALLMNCGHGLHQCRFDFLSLKIQSVILELELDEDGEFVENIKNECITQLLYSRVQYSVYIHTI